jgi:hypothetical protein
MLMKILMAAVPRRMQQQVAGNLATNFGIINPLVLNQFGYGSYGQVCLQVQFNNNLMITTPT